eukprot:s373_g22.t1
MGWEAVALALLMQTLQVLAVFFEDDVYWHERLLLWRYDDESWYILTPDLDIYAENLSGSGADGPSKVQTKGVDFRPISVPGPDQAWIVVENLENFKELPAPLIEPTVETALEDASADARTLPIDFDHQGVRFKEWRTLVTEVKDYAYPDWPFEGPATVLYLLKHMCKYGATPNNG